MGSYKPGDIITIKGTEFAVLDVEEGTAKDEKPDLSEYSTMELLQELVERAMRDE